MVGRFSRAQKLRTLFVATLFTGSFLLFLVQPLIARMALPRLGGAPAVWNSAMLLYQLLLLGGYAYAHLLASRPPRQQAAIHLALFAVAAPWLPLSLSRVDLSGQLVPALWVPCLLALSIGPLFFVVAAQAPLMQRWFSLSGGEEPYALYAASNLGSLLGLLAYPLLVEPLFDLHTQSLAWSAGYGLLALCVLSVGTFMLGAAAPERRTDAQSSPAPAWSLRLRWLLLAAVPSGLMLSTTTHLTTDIVAVPLLWVMPLGLYLLSFTIAFSARPALARTITLVFPFVMLGGGAFAFSSGAEAPAAWALLDLAVLFATCVVLHTEMHRIRPAARHLTLFYMAMSIGGVLGGALCSLVAPLVFDWTYEHPLLVLSGAALAPAFEARARLWLLLDALCRRFAPWLLLAAFTASLVAEGVLRPCASSLVPFTAQLLTLGLALVTLPRRALFVLCLAAAMLGQGGWHALELSVAGARVRSYFGTYTITSSKNTFRKLSHGTTIHGVQRLTAGHERDATSYYAQKSGVGLALSAAPELFGPSTRVGIVGLGAGTLACYRRPGQRFRFYEIDAAVVRIARDTSKFTFLSRCAADAPVVLGDARLSLTREPAASLDVLVVDAFSSDSVPMHLLTTEAFAQYARVLSPRGLLLVHISNRFLKLGPVVAAAGERTGFVGMLREFNPSPAELSQQGQTRSLWAVLSRDPAALGQLKERHAGDARGYTPLVPLAGFSPWTDDYGSIVPLLRH